MAHSYLGRVLIVVVVRDSHVQHLKQYFLSETRMEVQFAENGLRAFELARTSAPQIVITEILLPGADGLRLCQRLRNEPSTSQARILAYSFLSVEQRAREAGADLFILKPLRKNTLIQAVQTFLPDSQVSLRQKKTS